MSYAASHLRRCLCGRLPYAGTVGAACNGWTMRTYPNADRPLCPEKRTGLGVQASKASRVRLVDQQDTASGQDAQARLDAVLAFEEEARWKYTGAKEVAVRERFDLSLATYHQVLNVAIDIPEQEAKRPMTVRRLRRLREERRKVRGA